MAAHWLVAVPLTVLMLPLSSGAGLFPVQYSDPVTVLPATVTEGPALFSTWTAPFTELALSVIPPVSPDRVSVPLSCSPLTVTEPVAPVTLIRLGMVSAAHEPPSPSVTAPVAP